MKEFKLSEKIERIWIHEHKKFQRTYKDVVLTENIKEFIKILARKSYFDKERKCWVVSLKVVKEHAGEELVK